MKHNTIIILILTLLFSGVSVAENSQATTETITSGYKVALHSKVLNEDRSLLINLPQGYDKDNKQQYPVIVTLDGSTHFHHLSGTINWLSESAGRIPKMIVVALENTQRGRDMTASYNKGGADKFIQFIKTELVPYINKQYRTNGFRILAGHSMAGHLTLNVLHQHPELFNAYVAMAPWLHQDRGDTSLVDLLAAKVDKKAYNNKFVYLSIGDEPRLLPKYQKLASMFESHAPESLKLSSLTSPTDDHMSIPSATMNKALQDIFKPTRLSPTSETAQQGVEAIESYFDHLSKHVYGYPISPEAAINGLAYHVLREQGAEQALTILKQNNQKFPNSANTYNSLADVYYRNKNYQLALTQIDKAIAVAKLTQSESLPWFERRKSRIENAMQKSTN